VKREQAFKKRERKREGMKEKEEIKGEATDTLMFW
jgi:hypothetical protein